MRAKEPTSPTSPSNDGLVAFFAIACGWTWLLTAPAALAWMHHATPSPGAMAGAGLSAFGPLVAALAIAAPRKQLGEVFGRWRTNPLWIALALFTPAAVHVTAALVAAVAGAAPSQWLHPPASREQIAALIVFPLGEEFGWRGFAYPRLVERFGLVNGSLALGIGWGLWHLAYSITPAGGFDGFTFALILVELPLYSLLIAGFFEHANRSLAVAIAFHAGAHLDHIEVVPRSELALHVAHVCVLAVLAAGAAHWLRTRAAQPRRASLAA